MKILGVFLIVASLAVGCIAGNYIEQYSVEPFVGIAFCLFLMGICFLSLEDLLEEEEEQTEKGSVPYMRNPPPPPKKEIVDTFILSGKANYDFRFWYYDKKKDSREWRFFNEMSTTCQNALVNDWFREVHDFHSYIVRYDDGSFDYEITSDYFKEVFDFEDGPFRTFLDAQNGAIKTMEDIVYNKKPICPEFPEDKTRSR